MYTHMQNQKSKKDKYIKYNRFTLQTKEIKNDIHQLKNKTIGTKLITNTKKLKLKI